MVLGRDKRSYSPGAHEKTILSLPDGEEKRSGEGGRARAGGNEHLWHASKRHKQRTSTFPNSSLGWVNVQDVAQAHILAYEVPAASGRYCLVERVTHYADFVKIIHEIYPSLQLPQKCADDKPFVPTYQVPKEKTKSLGVDFIPLETEKFLSRPDSPHVHRLEQIPTIDLPPEFQGIIFGKFMSRSVHHVVVDSV